MAIARSIISIRQPIERAIREELFPLLRNLEPEFLVDSVALHDDYADDLQGALDRIRFEHFDLASRRAQVLGQRIVGEANERNRKKFYESVEQAIGVNLSAVVEEAGIEPVLKLKVRENVGLIKSIHENEFSKIETLVYENTIQGRTSAKSLIEELRVLGAKTDARARFIARDQTAKLNAALNRERNQALGIVEYVWKTSRDERVRETHRQKNGKTFRWDDPPKDTGHPGEDYQCRCRAEPVIVI